MLLLGAAVLTTYAQTPTQIQWQGYTWEVKNALSEGPGPNNWDPKNVWVDSQNCLHLKISNTGGHWSCAELWTNRALGFGTYRCEVPGEGLGKLDPNVVFSMFSYQGPDGLKEIDIEYAKWGIPRAKNLWWTVWPNDNEGQKADKGLSVDQNEDGSHPMIPVSDLMFTWSSSAVRYGSIESTNLDTITDFHDWNYHPTDYLHQIPQTPMPLHFNLWLFKGRPPTDGRPVEVIVRSFSKTE